jgi:mRNA interferase RelE/StbE
VSYTIILSKPAVKALRSLQSNVNSRVGAAIDSLKEEPRPAGCKKLMGQEELWRIRLGDYRIVYAVDDVIRVVDIRRIGHRGDIYR